MGGEVRTVEVRGTRIPQCSLGAGGPGAPPLLRFRQNFRPVVAQPGKLSSEGSEWSIARMKDWADNVGDYQPTRFPRNMPQNTLDSPHLSFDSRSQRGDFAGTLPSGTVVGE